MMTAGHRQRINKPRCADCDAGGKLHPYPTDRATEKQLSGDVPGGYEWLCPDCTFRRENPRAQPAIAPPRERAVPVQRERLFDF